MTTKTAEPFPQDAASSGHWAAAFRVGLVIAHDVEDSDVEALSQCIQLIPEFQPAPFVWTLSERTTRASGSAINNLGDLLLSGALALDARMERRRIARGESLTGGPASSAHHLAPRVELPPPSPDSPDSDAHRVIADAQLALIFFLGRDSPPQWLTQYASLGVVSAAILTRDVRRGEAHEDGRPAVGTDRLLVFFHVDGQAANCVIDSNTARRSISPARSRALLALRSVDLMSMVGRQIATGGSGSASFLDPSKRINPRALTTSKAKRSSLDGLHQTFTIGRDRVRAAIDLRFFEQRWEMAFSREPFASVQSVAERLHEFNVLHPPRGAMWADPFPVRFEGRDLIFFEQEFRSEGYGHIAAAELLPDGRLTTPVRVLEIGSHLSYPSVFESDGAWFMIPESVASGTVSLYRASEFPWTWRKECDLITDHRLVDCTAFQHDGSWWMMGCRVGADLRPYEDLELFRADRLTGPWLPHARNPIVSDATRGRPAGHVFVENQKLVRPAQDCSRRYGYGLSFQEIGHLSATGYDERTIVSRVADWDARILGVHTFNRSSTLSCTDFLIRERRPGLLRSFSRRSALV